MLPGWECGFVIECLSGMGKSYGLILKTAKQKAHTREKPTCEALEDMAALQDYEEVGGDAVGEDKKEKEEY